MRKELKKGDIEYEMFNDYWQSLISEADAFLAKYKTKYAEDLITAYLDSRQRMYKDLKMP